MGHCDILLLFFCGKTVVGITKPCCNKFFKVFFFLCVDNDVLRACSQEGSSFKGKCSWAIRYSAIPLKDQTTVELEHLWSGLPYLKFEKMNVCEILS